MEGFEPVKKQGCFGGPQNSGPQNDAIFEGFRILRVARVGNFIRSLHVEICLKLFEHNRKETSKKSPRILQFSSTVSSRTCQLKSPSAHGTLVLVGGVNDGYGPSETKGVLNAVTFPHV